MIFSLKKGGAYFRINRPTIKRMQIETQNQSLNERKQVDKKIESNIWW